MHTNKIRKAENSSREKEYRNTKIDLKLSSAGRN